MNGTIFPVLFGFANQHEFNRVKSSWPKFLINKQNRRWHHAQNSTTAK
ncbi:hypothetical protein D1BOALGB6SA_18 [Olavius sp. associated proteobacterium Delta 1]|nr:hypothetical protein D1BOALGB6SA_18 [Olavius sp. associated proteobacterium Delta 1]